MELINGETRHARHPETFEIPDRAARANLNRGDFAKIGLISGETGERFWVRIAERLPGGRYRGTVDNELIISALPVGAAVEFGPEHVLSITPRADDAPRVVAV